VAANQTWAVDFIHDSLSSGRRFRAFAVLDEWSRKAAAPLDCQSDFGYVQQGCRPALVSEAFQRFE
jgi:hypothetical protein